MENMTETYLNQNDNYKIYKQMFVTKISSTKDVKDEKNKGNVIQSPIQAEAQATSIICNPMVQCFAPPFAPPLIKNDSNNPNSAKGCYFSDYKIYTAKSTRDSNRPFIKAHIDSLNLDVLFYATKSDCAKLQILKNLKSGQHDNEKSNLTIDITRACFAYSTTGAKYGLEKTTDVPTENLFDFEKNGKVYNHDAKNLIDVLKFIETAILPKNVEGPQSILITAAINLKSQYLIAIINRKFYEYQNFNNAKDILIINAKLKLEQDKELRKELAGLINLYNNYILEPQKFLKEINSINSDAAENEKNKKEILTNIPFILKDIGLVKSDNFRASQKLKDPKDIFEKIEKEITIVANQINYKEIRASIESINLTPHFQHLRYTCKLAEENVKEAFGEYLNQIDLTPFLERQKRAIGEDGKAPEAKAFEQFKDELYKYSIDTKNRVAKDFYDGLKTVGEQTIKDFASNYQEEIIKSFDEKCGENNFFIKQQENPKILNSFKTAREKFEEFKTETMRSIEKINEVESVLIPIAQEKINEVESVLISIAKEIANDFNKGEQSATKIKKTVKHFITITNKANEALQKAISKENSRQKQLLDAEKQKENDEIDEKNKMFTFLENVFKKDFSKFPEPHDFLKNCCNKNKNYSSPSTTFKNTIIKDIPSFYLKQLAGKLSEKLAGKNLEQEKITCETALDQFTFFNSKIGTTISKIQTLINTIKESYEDHPFSFPLTIKLTTRSGRNKTIKLNDTAIEAYIKNTGKLDSDSFLIIKILQNYEKLSFEDSEKTLCLQEKSTSKTDDNLRLSVLLDEAQNKLDASCDKIKKINKLLYNEQEKNNELTTLCLDIQKSLASLPKDKEKREEIIDQFNKTLQDLSVKQKTEKPTTKEEDRLKTEKKVYHAINSAKILSKLDLTNFLFTKKLDHAPLRVVSIKEEKC